MKRQVRFRASIYIDIFINENTEQICDCEIQPCDLHSEHKDLETMREEAREKIRLVVNEITNPENKNIPNDVFNPYIGGVAKYEPRDLLNPLDREI